MGTAPEVMEVLWKKGPRDTFLSSVLGTGTESVYSKNCHPPPPTTHTHTHTHRHTHTHTQSIASLHLEHLHHLRALGVMATVTMTTAEKLDEGDETAGSSDRELGAKEQSTCADPPVTCHPLPPSSLSYGRLEERL